MKNKTKIILLIEGVFILLVLAYLFFSTAPKQIYPLQGMSISEQDFSFEIQNSEEVLISKDSNFENFVRLKEGDKITLPPGTYFWKVKSKLRESETKSFTIESVVGLNLIQREGVYELENSGNVNLNVTKENFSEVLSIFIDVGEFEVFEKDNSTYIGRQK